MLVFSWVFRYTRYHKNNTTGMKNSLSWIRATAKPSSLVLLVLLASFIGPIVDVNAALAAASTGTWIDRGDVSYNGEIYTAFKVFSGQRSPVNTNMALNGTNTCTPMGPGGPGTMVTDNMTITNFYNTTPDKVSVTTYQLQGSQQHGYDCTPNTVTITMTNSYYSVGGAAQATWTVSVATLRDQYDPSTVRYDYQISFDGLPFVSTLPAFNSMTLVGPTGCIHNGVLSPDSLRISNVSSGVDALVQLENPDGKGGCVAAPATHTTLTNTYNDITPNLNAAWGQTSDPSGPNQSINISGSGGVTTYNESSVNGNVMSLVPKSAYGASRETMTVGSSVASYLDILTGLADSPCSVNTCDATHYQNLDYYWAPVNLVSSLNPAPGDSSSGSGSGSSSGVTCSLSTGIDWILCPLINIGTGAITGVGNALATFLYTPTQQIFTPQFQTVFNTFRNLGIAILVIVGLVMVASQAAGLEIFAAYTVRKALPRIVIAAIGMAVAWPILLFVITFFNDLGTWANQLIVSTVSSTSSGASLSSFDGGSILELIIGGAAGAAYLIVIGGAGVALSLLGTLLLALLIGFFVLAIRQMVILVAVLIAPLAIAMAVLPGTATLWNFWRKSLITALVMFPLIMAFLGAGEALSSIAMAASQAPGVSSGQAGTWKFVAIIALIAPLAMLPSAFTLAGGIMSTVMGLATGNKFVRGAFENAAKYRQAQRAENWNKTKAGIRFAGNNPLSKLVNSAGGEAGAFLGSQNKLGYFRKSVRNAARDQNQAIAAAEYTKHPRTAAGQFNDNMLRAQTYATAAEARAGLARDFGMTDGTKIEQAIRDAQVNGGFGGARSRFAMQQLAATGTGYDNMDQMLRTVARVSNGNGSVINSAIGNMRGLAERSGRNDLKAGYQNMVDLATQMQANGNSSAGLEDRVEDLVVEAGRGTDNASLLRNKTPSVKNISQALANGLDRQLRRASDPSLSDAQRREASEMAGSIRAKIENMQQAGTFGYGPEVNQEAFDVRLTSTPGYQQNSQRVTQQVQIQTVAETDQFGNTRMVRRPLNIAMGESRQRQLQRARPDDETLRGGRGGGPTEE